MHGIDWGNVPAWCSAVLTSGSLFLGFYILLRDRRKEEKAEARRLVFGYEASSDHNHWVIKAYNTSDRPFTDLGVYAAGPVGGYFSDTVLLPGAATECEVPRNDFYRLVVLFVDGDGQPWVKSLITGELRRIPWEPGKQVKAVRRVYERSSHDKMPPRLGSNH